MPAKISVSAPLPPLTVTTSLPPLVEYDSVAFAPTPEIAIWSVDENPEITACSPFPALAIEAISSVLSPSEKVSEPAIVAVADSSSTVPPPLSTILLAVAPPATASVPASCTVSLATAAVTPLTS